MDTGGPQMRHSRVWWGIDYGTIVYNASCLCPQLLITVLVGTMYVRSVRRTPGGSGSGVGSNSRPNDCPRLRLRRSQRVLDRQLKGGGGFLSTSDRRAVAPGSQYPGVKVWRVVWSRSHHLDRSTRRRSSSCLANHRDHIAPLCCQVPGGKTSLHDRSHNNLACSHKLGILSHRVIRNPSQ